MNSDQLPTIAPEKTPLFIGVGVQFTGTVRHTGPQDEKAVILGQLTGDVEWNGVLQVPYGGKVVVERSMRCREMTIDGKIVGANDEVVIETGHLRLGQSASIDAATVSVSPGGLEQSRGSVVNAKLRMTKDNAYASQPSAATEAATAPSLTLVPSTAAAAAAQVGDDFGDEVSSLVQPEASTPGSAYGS